MPRFLSCIITRPRRSVLISWLLDKLTVEGDSGSRIGDVTSWSFGANGVLETAAESGGDRIFLGVCSGAPPFFISVLMN